MKKQGQWQPPKKVWPREVDYWIEMQALFHSEHELLREYVRLARIAKVAVVKSAEWLA